jgi:purine-binding chemotaxis protein CheW
MRGPIMKDKKGHPVAITDDTMQLVTFQVGAEEFGLDIRSVAEVVRPLRITSLPRMPEFIEGVINLRGAIIPVVDLRKRFGLEAATGPAKKSRMLITRGAVRGPGSAGGDLLGLVVDGVREVLFIPRQQIDPTPAAARGLQADFIGGVGKTGDRLVILVDITKILSRQEREALAEAGDA